MPLPSQLLDSIRNPDNLRRQPRVKDDLDLDFNSLRISGEEDHVYGNLRDLQPIKTDAMKDEMEKIKSSLSKIENLLQMDGGKKKKKKSEEKIPVCSS